MNVVSIKGVNLVDVIPANDSGNVTDRAYVCELCLSKHEVLNTLFIGNVVHDCTCAVEGCANHNHDDSLCLYEIEVKQMEPTLENGLIIVPFHLPEDKAPVFAVISENGATLGNDYHIGTDGLTMKAEPLVYESLDCGKGWLFRPYESNHFITVKLGDDGLLADLWAIDDNGDDYVIDETGIEFSEMFFIDSFNADDHLNMTAKEITESLELQEEHSFSRLLTVGGLEVEAYTSQRGKDGYEAYIDITSDNGESFKRLDALPATLAELTREVALLTHPV